MKDLQTREDKASLLYNTCCRRKKNYARVFIAPAFKRETALMRKGDYVCVPLVQKADVRRMADFQDFEDAGINVIEDKFEDWLCENLDKPFIIISINSDYYIPMQAWRDLNPMCHKILTVTHIFDEYMTAAHS